MREISARLAHAASDCEDGEITFLMSTISTLVITEVYPAPDSKKIILLTRLQVSDDDFEAAETHLRGVHTLLDSRGGFESFRSEFILCKSASLSVSAITSSSAPLTWLQSRNPGRYGARPSDYISNPTQKSGASL